jgi:hypothetical protein
MTRKPAAIEFCDVQHALSALRTFASSSTFHQPTQRPMILGRSQVAAAAANFIYIR